MTEQKNRIALVTGGNKGIGLEIARQLAEAGVHVVLGARDPDRGNSAVDQLVANGLAVSPISIDVADAGSIASAADKIERDHGKLDILVNNAGIIDAQDGAPSVTLPDAVRRIFNTNFFGVLSVIQAMLPLLRKAPAGRIVNLSSALGSLSINGDASSPFYSSRLLGYNASKAALNMLTVQLGEELRGTGILVNSVSPGFAKTDLTGNNGRVTAAEGAIAPVRYALLDDTDAVTGSFAGINGPIPW